VAAGARADLAPEFTLREAASFLDPPISARQLAAIVKALMITPNGRRYTGRPGPPEHTYNSAELIRLHTAVSAWLTRV
jgi:hypothetical protein